MNVRQVLRDLPMRIDTYEFFEEDEGCITYKLHAKAERLADEDKLYLMRVSKAGKQSETIHKERQIHSQFHRVYFFPQVEYYKETDEGSVLVFEYAKHSNIGVLKTEDAQFMAQTLDMMHNPRKEFWGNYIPDRTDFSIEHYFNWLYYDRIHALDNDAYEIIKDKIKIFRKEIEKVRDLFNYKQFSLCHGNLKRSTCLYRANFTLVFIDWRRAHYAPFVVDVARFFFNEQYTREEKKSFYEIYPKAKEDQKKEVEFLLKMYTFEEELEKLERKFVLRERTASKFI